MIDQLKDLKDTYQTVYSQINKAKEPLEELITLQKFLAALAEDPSLLTEKMDKDYQRYFYDDFTQGLLKNLSRERSKNDKYLDVIASIYETFLKLLIQELQRGHSNQQFFDSIKQLFEYDNILHNYNYQIPEDELKRLRNTNQEWRKELKEGDMVDAIIDENNRCSGWSQARISQVNQDLLHLQFNYDTKNADRFMDRWSVEIAPFETKTKEIFQWKSEIQANQQVDAHDKTVWNKSTILEIKEQDVAPDRRIKMALIAYRIYVENGAKTDERGAYDGWSNRFDEWIPLYSPKIQPFFTKTQKGIQDDIDIDEEVDNQIKAEEGKGKIYSVPRLRKCTSSLYINLINNFGNMGGYDQILTYLEQNSADQELDLNGLSTLMLIVSTPYLIYHRDFIQEYGPKIVAVCKKKLSDAPEKSLRDVRREKIEAIIKSIDNIQRRLITKEEREKETEILRLEVSLMCLKSSFMERRIQGIRDLNQIIKNNRLMGSKSFSAQFLIDWMQNNEVFNILFDQKRTHLQLVQRCSDIVKLLLQENMFSPNLMEAFWSLAKSDYYKFEIYKIINESSLYLKQVHIDYFFEQIRQVAPEKLAMEEFQCLSEMGKYAIDDSFKEKVSDFFWQLISNSENCKEELVNSCITKFCEMVKNWELSRKMTFFVSLTHNLKQNKSSLPSLRLFKGLLKDQKDKGTYTNYNTSPTKQSSEQQSSGIVEQAVSTELTLAQVLTSLIDEHKVVEIVLENLRQYCELANEKVNEESINENRKKLHLVSAKYSHHEEVDERLQFVKYLASISDFKISKIELGVIYDLLVVRSKIPSDQEEYLTWCKSSCEQSSILTTILDLNEVGEFFTEKMQSKELDVSNMLVVGFDFLQQYFLSANEKEQTLMKIVKTQKVNKFSSMNYSYTTGMYGYAAYGQQMKSFQNKPTTNDDEDSAPQFKITQPPSNLVKLDIVWNMALNCENPKVVPKAIDFLIKVFSSIDEDLQGQRIAIQDELIEGCIGIIRNSQDEKTIKRVIDILKNIIYEAEKKGTGDVQPHSALLKGELLEKITIKNKASPKRGNIVMSIYSNTTIWEFKKVVAKQLELAPKYLKLEKGGKILKDIENGRTLGELGFSNNESVTATKINVEEEVPNAPLIGPNGKLSEKALQIFNEWFDMYSDETSGMTRETCALFIKGCTGEHPSAQDERISQLFKSYDSNNDGRIEREEFITFYETAARNKPDTVRENLRAHNIRNDLKKLSEIQEESSYSNDEMPRYKISKNQEQFDLLVSLLDRRDSSSEAAWNLIQMLATNEALYKRVLQLKTAIDPSTGQIDWNKFFDTNSVYKLLYTLQIIEAVMEEGEGAGLERVTVIEDENANKKIPKAPPLPGDTAGGPQEPPKPSEPEQQQPQPEDKVEGTPQFLKKHSTIVHNENEDSQLRAEWTAMFLENNGFQYILKVFMEKQIKNQDSINEYNESFELKHIAFLLKLLRIFIMAAFSTSSESSVYAVASLVRRTSQIQEEQITQDSSGSRFKQLQKLLSGPIGSSIIEVIDYKSLQSKILNVIAQILGKQTLIFEDKLIIENALSLWVGCVLHKNDLFNEFYTFEGDNLSNIKTCKDLILNGLLFCSQEKVREEFKQSLSSLSHRLISSEALKQPPLFYLLKLLSENFALISQYQCKQYFELFCELIDQYFLARHLIANQEAFNPEQLLSQIIDKIKEYNKSASEGSIINKDQTDEQASQAQEEQENIYIGLLQLTGKIIDNFDISFSEKVVQQKNLIDEIFINFLFQSVFKKDGKNAINQLRIKPKESSKKQSKKQSFGKKSKDAAFKLLNSLIKKSPVLMNTFLEKSMGPLMALIKRHDGWNYSPPGTSERTQKYVGLKNLGCICYMNAMMQQFFMIPPFRYNLLCVDDSTPEFLQEYKGSQIDDNMLHQLQKLMAHLELSERQDYNPFEFCFAFKDFEGNPTNTGEQKDAQEFLNLLFDRLENQLKGTPRKYLLQSIFQYKTSSQLLCSECGKVKNRIEDNYNLSLTVKDIKSMHDSLSKLIEGDIINDYECEGCNKKVDIRKRTLLTSTPNVLIVHLQRIIFNFDTFRNDKINTFFEFPYQLDLKPYSFYEVMKNENRLKKPKKEGEEEEEEQQQEDNNDKKKDEDDNQWPEEDDCFEYKLVGVVVHSGTANAGHYWSYINTKRGYNEPEESDPNWRQTETDPWMEFNDSSVREFNFEKLKEDCYGGDGKGGNDDSWSFGGSYGKSAYMLVYERKIKKDLKVLVPKEEVESTKAGGEQVIFDEAKEEYYKLINYREGVEDIAPNQIYKNVFEDNTKFEFENDIYSSEFFEFVKGILNAISILDSDSKNPKEVMNEVKKNMISVGRKVILEVLAKCFHNQPIKEIIAGLIDTFKTDESLCKDFLEQCLNEDEGAYLLDILLDCSDNVARLNVGLLVKFILNKLKFLEKDILYESEQFQITDDKGENHMAYRPKAICARFIMKCFSVLNTQVAKNWIKFDNFLEIIYSFALGDRELSGKPEDAEADREIIQEQRIGIEFFFRNRFIEKACDFLLGKKSPLFNPQIEKRSEMGTSYSSPNFGPIIKVITRMITDDEFLAKYPLSELEKKMFLHNDLLKVMLGSNQGSKQFGKCLAKMCKENIKLSKKVSKVFIKAINQSNYENVKNYLIALKYFLRTEDSLKLKKLEWVLGISQIIAKKNYREEKFRYGLEHVDKINEEANTYVSPLLNGPEESLLAQLLKCKGKQDQLAVSCLREMLSMMEKDDDIARFVYRSAPSTYQMARYTDWIKPYLDYQKQDIERNNSYSYYKTKHENVLASLQLLTKIDEKFKIFAQEEIELKNKMLDSGSFEGLQYNWLGYQSPEVINHFPPQLIIGKQVGEDKEFLVYDEDPLVKVTIYEVSNEYNYSNPTNLFNLSLPHIDLRTTSYQTINYAQYKKQNFDYERSMAAQKKAAEEEGHQDQEQATPDTGSDPQEEIKEPVEEAQMPPIQTFDWFTNKKEASLLLKICIQNKTSETVKIALTLESQGELINTFMPKSPFVETLYQNEQKYIAHLQKIDPSKPFGQLTIIAESQVKQNSLQKTVSNDRNTMNKTDFTINVIDTTTQGSSLRCPKCNELNLYTDYCTKCEGYGQTYGPSQLDNGSNYMY